MKYRVIVEPRAASDIEKAYLWIAERAPESAIAWFNGIYEAIELLETFPERYPHAPENAFFEEEIRQLYYGNRVGRYRILFTITDHTVHILHVRHGRRRRLGGQASENPDED